MLGLQKFESSDEPAGPQGPELWQGFSAGMTIDQAATAVGVIPNPTPGNLANGATSELIIPSFALNSDTYTVNLYFVRGRLVQVTISLDRPADISTAYEVATLLRAKYGPEIMSNRPDVEALGFFNAEWLAQNGVNVSLFCMEEVALNVNYQLRVAYEAAKL